MVAHIVLFIIVFLFSSAPAAVTVRLFGKVTDAITKEPIPRARIEIQELKRGAVSRIDGTYEIPALPHGVYQMIAYANGYIADTLTVTITTENVERNIALISAQVQGRAVTIVGQVNKDDLTGSSQSVSILDQATLDEHRGQTLGETLRDIPGVTLLTTGASISKPIVRGLHSDRIVVVNAGVTQQGQQWGAEHAPEIDPFAASRIEVIKGASGVEYGVGAIGGVINIQPRALVTEGGIRGELSLNGFSNNMHGASALLLEGKLAEGWGWRVQGSARKAGNSSTPNYVLGNTGFEELDGTATIGYHAPGIGVEAYYSRFGTELGIFSGSHIGNTSDLERAIARGKPEATYEFTYDILPPKQQIAHDLLSVRAEYLIGSIGTVELHGNYQQNDRNEFDAHVRFRETRPDDPPATTLLLKTNSAELKLHHLPVENVFGTIGATIAHQNNAVGGSTILIPPFSATTYAVYVIEHLLAGDWTFDAGGRYDVIGRDVSSTSKNQAASQSYANFSGAVGSIWQFAEYWSLGANLGMAWRPPAVNELFSNNVHHGTAQFEIGDPYLTEENSFNVDLTLRHQTERLRGELSLYRNAINDYIFLEPDTTPTLTIRGAFPTFRFRQTDAQLLGAEASLEYQFLAPLKLTAVVSLVRGTNILSTEPLFQMPSDRLKFTAHYDLIHDEPGTFEEMFVEVSARAVARQKQVPAQQDYAAAPPGYLLLDASLTTDINLLGTTMHASLGCENLFNKDYRDYLSRYRYFASDPGRTVALRISIPFGDQPTNHNEP